MRKIISILLLVAVSIGLFSCSTPAKSGEFDETNNITVISRESSSGTRSAFDELMGIVVKDGGNVTDKLFSEAIIVDSTDAVASKVEVDKYAIGYTSLGSINDKIKALSIDNIEATIENVKNGTYKISRPFLLSTKAEVSEIAMDFIKYIISKQGQEIIKSKGYIKIDDAATEYKSTALEGKFTLSGSTSVEKIMEQLKQDYIVLNPKIEIEIIYSGSGAGIKDVTDGKVDIGMSSRVLTADEKNLLTDKTIALDGIAVIVNKDNPITSLTSEQITKIFMGDLKTWEKK